MIGDKKLLFGEVLILPKLSDFILYTVVAVGFSLRFSSFYVAT